MLALACALAACQSDLPHRRALRLPVDTASLLLNPADSIWLESILSIGELDGRPEYAFGRVGAVLPRSDSGFLVCDSQDAQLRLYRPGGSFERKIGQSGSGPDEYESCSSMVLDRRLNLIVNDIGNGRLVVYDDRLRYVGVEPWPYLGILAAFDLAERRWAIEFRSGRGGDERSWNVLVIRDSAGNRVDSLTAPSLRLQRGLQAVSFGTDDGLLTSRTGDTLWAVLANGGLVSARSDEYRVHVVTALGLVRTLSRDVRPIDYADAERREWMAAIERVGPGRALPLPDRKPVVRELRSDEVGRIWVRVADTAYRRLRRGQEATSSRPTLTHFERGVWDIFNLETGLYIGRVELPPGHRIIASLGDRLWLVGTGADDQQVLSVMRLRWLGTLAR